MNRSSAIVKSTHALLDRLNALESHLSEDKRKLKIRVAEGGLLTDHYTHAGAGSHIQGKRGIMHAKWLRVDSTMITGSCNFTTSSQCNLEVTTLVDLSEAGVLEAKRLFDLYWEAATPFT